MSERTLQDALDHAKQWKKTEHFSRTNLVVEDLILLADEIKRLQEESRCAGCGNSPAFCDFCGSGDEWNVF